MEAQSERNVVLTGFMGTGKTTVGRVIAERLNYQFADTDEIIATRHGPIGEIIKRLGWSAFRAMERQVARELEGRTRVVISTGGRLMLDPECAALLQPNADVVCLTADADTIVERLGADDQKRPLLDFDDAAERVAALLSERAPAYGQFRAVSTEGRTPQAVADTVVEELRR